MPKPGRKGNWRNQYTEHDFRSAEPARRVSFKTSRGGPGKQDRGKDWSASIRAHLEEEDVDMGASNIPRFSNKKYLKGGKRGQRSGSPVPHRNGKRKLLEGPTSWYKIYLPYGNKYDKQFILQFLRDNITPMPLIPIMWNINGTSVSFFIDDFKTAEKLHSLDRSVQLPDGFKLAIRVTSGSPNVDVNSAMKEKMKLAMAKRYNPATRALDMSQFHLDPDLSEVFCALFKPIICLSAIDIMSENIPELEALNFNDNKIQMLSHLRKINTKLPNLKILYLGANKLRDIAQLDNLNGVPIVELLLDGNPLCDKFRDQTTYISEVRKRFPKVLKLDGIDLPPPISFDIEEVSLPSSKQTFLCNPDGQGIVRQFLEQYFTILDSDNRQPLLQAYHECAVFSMTMAYPYGQHPKNSAWLNWYSTDNRNLQRISDPDRRLKLLKQGHLQVVAFLQEMPQSKHDIHSFTVDLNLFTPQMLLVSVSGMFKELKSSHKTPPIRHFFRTFIIVPSGSGFCIANETLHVSNATEDQAKCAFKTPVPNPVPPTPVSSPVATPVPVNIPDDTTKQQMIQAMSQESGMNLKWSQECLENTNWDYQQAGIVFTEAKNKGVIPPEAFLK